MKDKINSIDMNGKLEREEIYNLFKTHSSKTNKEISEKINNFKHNIDFFEFYSNEDIKNLLNIFVLKLPEDNDENFSSFESDIEQYISCISQIILSIKLFLKTYDILAKIVTNAKNHLSTLKYENKLENYNQECLFSYLESLLKISEKNTEIYSSPSTLLNSNVSSCEDTSKNFLFSKYSSGYKLDEFSNGETDSIVYENQPTPRFESESDEEFENQKKKNSKFKKTPENNSPTQKDSVLTLSKYVFVDEPITPQNHELKLCESPVVRPKKKKTSTQERKPRTEKFDNHINKRKISLETDRNNRNNNKNHYRNLLEMINKIYKRGLINSEEKVKLKQLVIKKSKKIEYLYYNIYTNSKNDKKALVTEVKKIVN